MTELEFLPQPYMLQDEFLALSVVKLCWPLETCHAFKIKIMYTPPKYAASKLEVRNNMPSI
jgi:hypothetical protein